MSPENDTSVSGLVMFCVGENEHRRGPLPVLACAVRLLPTSTFLVLRIILK